MMSPPKDQGAPKGGAERSSAGAGTDNKSKQQGAGPQGGYEQPGGYGGQGWGGPGGYPFPPWWAMNPGMAGPYGMYSVTPAAYSSDTMKAANFIAS